MFAERFLKPSGTKQLMEDLSEVASGDSPVINLGGGNPGLVPQAHERFRQRIGAMLEERSIDAILRRYDGPQGHLQFSQRDTAWRRAGLCQKRSVCQDDLASPSQHGPVFQKEEFRLT